MLFVILNVLAIEMSSQNWFCNSCHTMNDYYDTWEVSAHKDTKCVQCHISPGIGNFLHAKINGLGQVADVVLDRASIKPSTSVGRLACTRSGCHDLDEVRDTSKKDGKYFFNHGKHIDLEYLGIKLACSSCHSNISGDEHFAINTNVCVVCHLSGNGLDEEHARDAKADSDRSDKSAKNATRQCKKCHEPPDHPVQYNGLEVIHADYLAYGAAASPVMTMRPSRPEKLRMHIA